jgi:hypothetical protein
VLENREIFYNFHSLTFKHRDFVFGKEGKKALSYKNNFPAACIFNVKLFAESKNFTLCGVFYFSPFVIDIEFVLEGKNLLLNVKLHFVSPFFIFSAFADSIS